MNMLINSPVNLIVRTNIYNIGFVYLKISFGSYEGPQGPPIRLLVNMNNQSDCYKDHS